MLAALETLSIAALLTMVRGKKDPPGKGLCFGGSGSWPGTAGL
jgi:hypothetical protein